MLSKRTFAILLPCIGIALSACSLITNVDRTKIDENGEGGAGGADGENGGGEAGSENGGSTTGTN
jgi:hypothetical protein